MPKAISQRASAKLMFASVAWLGLVLCLALWSLTAPVHAQGDAFSSNEQDIYNTNLISQIVRSYHYRRTPQNDAYSESVLELYLKQLDPYKLHFTEQDTQALEQQRYNLDNDFRNGDLDTGLQIYHRYLQRAKQRLDYYLKLAKNRRFNFKLQEHLSFDSETITRVQDDVALQDRWRKWVKNDYLALLLEERKEADIREQLHKRYTRLRSIFEQTKHEDAYSAAINAYLGVLDPHSNYMSPQEQENFRIHMSLSLEGIGAVLRSENNFTTIHRIIPGGPAARDGRLKAGDRIIAVASKKNEPFSDVEGWRLNDVVQLIRGPKNSLVRLRVLGKQQRPGDRARLIALTRDKIELEDQAAQGHKTKIKPEPRHGSKRNLSIGVIRVPTFYQDFKQRQSGNKNYRSSTRDVAKIITELKKGGLDGLVMDLRSNGGGALEEAINLVGLFISTGPVVQVRSFDGKVKVNKDLDKRMAYSGPLAVLIDRNSASASEIFAGAIQDYGRGLVLGETSFGKGTVQHLFNLNDMAIEDVDTPLGQLKITIAQFFRINGESTQYRGVEPDIRMYPSYDHDQYGESSLEFSMPWAKIRKSYYQSIFPESARIEMSIPILRSHYLRRKEKNEALQKLWNSYAHNSRNAANRNVSLNEAQRRSELKEQEDLVSIALPDSYEKLADSFEKDPILQEASHILADFTLITQTSNNKDKDS